MPEEENDLARLQSVRSERCWRISYSRTDVEGDLTSGMRENRNQIEMFASDMPRFKNTEMIYQENKEIIVFCYKFK